MGKTNGRISGSCNIWKKMEIHSEDLSSPPQQDSNPRSQHSLQACPLPNSTPQDKFLAAGLTGHADSLLLPVLPECRCFCHPAVVCLAVGTPAAQAEPAAAVVPVTPWQRGLLSCRCSALSQLGLPQPSDSVQGSSQ